MPLFAVKMAQAPQQIAIQDLDVAQLSEVRKQLEDVRIYHLETYTIDLTLKTTSGAETSYQLFHSAKSSSRKVQSLRGERERSRERT